MQIKLPSGDFSETVVLVTANGEPYAAGNVIQSSTKYTYYFTSTASFGNVSNGDTLREEVTKDAAGTITLTEWYNESAGNVLCTVTPVPDTNCTPQSSTPAREETQKAAVEKLEALRLLMSSLNGNTDQIEALQTTLNSSITTLQSYVDSVETLLTSLGGNTDQVEALLNTLGVQTDQVEPLLTDIKAAIGNQAKATDTQPVSLASVPLPTGAVKETGGNLDKLVDAQGAKADAAANNTTSPWSVIALLKGVFAKLSGTLAIDGTVSVDNFPETQGISAASLPLPAGAATSAKQDAGNNSLAAIQTALSDGTQKTQVTSLPSLPAGTNAIGTVTVGGQTFYASTNNSVSQALATGATWNGTVESVIQQPGAWITVTSDKDVTLTINQYKDTGATVVDVPAQVYPVQAGVPFALARDIKGNYIKLSVSNTSGASAALTVDTYYGPLVNTNHAEGYAVANQSASIAVANTAVAIPNFTLLQGGNLRAAPTNNAAGVYVGKAGVTAATGFPLLPGEAFPVPAGNTGIWYAVGATVGDKVILAGA